MLDCSSFDNTVQFSSQNTNATSTPSSPTSRLLLEYEMHLRNTLAKGMDAESYSLHTFEALLSQSLENLGITKFLFVSSLFFRSMIIFILKHNFLVILYLMFTLIQSYHCTYFIIMKKYECSYRIRRESSRIQSEEPLSIKET